MSRRALLGCVILAAALRALFFSGGSLYDDLAYIRRALQLAGGDFSLPASHFDARLGLVGPPALVCALLGAAPITMVLYPFICSLASVAVAHHVGGRLFGPRVATLSALLAAVAPIELIYASQLYANEPVTLLCGGALGLFLLAEREPRAWRHLACGALLGAATLVHETAILVLVFYPVHALLVGRPRLAHLAAAAGLALVLAVDPLVHGLMGDPLARLHILAAPHGIREATEYLPWTAGWVAEPILRVFSEQELGLFPWLVAPIAALRAVRGGDATRRALALMVLSIALWLLYGTTSPTSWETLVRVPRFLAPLVLPSIWLLARELDGWRPRWRRAAVAALAATSILCALVDGGRARLAAFRELAAFLDRAGAGAVSGDWRTTVPLRLVAPRFRVATFQQQPRPSPGTFVVLRPDGEPAPAGIRLERVGEIPRPPSVYDRLLGNALAQRVLRAVRGPQRMRSLSDWRTPALTVYRVP